MTAKEYLSQLNIIKLKIRYLILDLERYDRIMLSCSSSNFDVECVSKSLAKESPNHKALEKYYETKDKIKEQEDNLEQMTDEVTKTIESLDNDDYKLILKYKYLDGMSFSDIKEKLFVSYSSIKRWHKEALLQISKVFGLTLQDSE